MIFRRLRADVAQTRAEISSAADDARATVELLATLATVAIVVACVAVVLAADRP